MSNTLASLIVELGADTARLQQDMGKAHAIAERTFGNMQHMAEKLGRALGGISAGAIIGLAKHSVDAADALNDLNKTTQIAVENLAGLQFAAKASGGDLNGIASSIAKLTQNMGLNAEKFQALGITTKDPLEAFKRLSDIFSKLEDPQLRAALGAETLGKQWQAAAPLMSEGSAKISEMIERGQKLSGITGEMAARADEFNDKLLDLTGSAAGWNGVVNSALPLMNTLLEDLIRLRDESSNLYSENLLVETLKAVVIVGGNVGFVLRGIGTELGGLSAQAAALATGNLSEFRVIGERMAEDAERNRKAFDAWEKKIIDLGTAADRTGPALAKMAAAAEDQVDRAAKSAAAAAKRLETAKAEVIARSIIGGGASAKAPAMVAMDAHMKDFQAHQLKVLKEQERINKSLEEMERSLGSASSDIRFQTELLGLSATEQERLTIFRKLENEVIKLSEGLDEERVALLFEQLETAKKQVIEALRLKGVKQDELALGEMLKKQGLDRLAAEVRQNEQITNSLTDALMRGFENGKGLAENFRDTLKNLFNTLVLRPIIQPVAQSGANWIQSLLGMGGGGGGAGGGGFNLGTLLNIGGSMAGGMGSGIAGLGSLFGSSTLSAFGAGMQGSTLAAGLAGPTTVGAGGAMGLGAQAGQFMAAAGPWVAAALAIYALHKAFGDKGENWKGQLGFGANANAYSFSTIFGQQGFANLQGNDAVNKQIQAFMASTGGIDTMLGKGLTQDQIARITGNLAGYNRRTDGQPAEFAFGKDDQTASAQLTLEFLKAKYGVVFDEIDKTFADFIRGYTGKSEDLVQQIGTFAQLVNSLAGTDVQGLNLTSLRAMQADGEELTDTMQRVAAGFSSINGLFIDETDAYMQALSMVQSEFDALDIDMAINADSFKTLRDSLDLSTEAGRAMFDMLVRIAPAMQQIEQASAQMMAGFNAAMAQIFGSSYSRQMIELQAAGLVSRFQGMTGLFAGMDPLSVFQGIGNANPGDIQYLMNGGGPELQTLLTQIIQLYAQYVGLQEQVNTGTGNLGGVISTTVDQLSQAKAGLREYLDRLFLDANLSPLNPTARFAEAQSQFQRMLLLAQGGDLAAIGNLPGISDTLLQLGKLVLPNAGAYNDLFRMVTTGIGGVAGVSQGEINQRLSSALPQSSPLASQADIQGLTSIMTALYERLDVGIPVNDGATQQALAEVRTEIESLKRATAL